MKNMTPEVLLLLRQIAENENHIAFEKLYKSYFKKSYSIAYYFLKSADLAEEVVSDVFLLFWQNRSSLAAVKDWDSYLYITIRNRSLYYIDQTSKMPSESIDLFTVSVATEEDTPEKALLKKELEETLRQAINDLPDRCKAIFQLVKEEGLSYKQVGDILDISPRTVNTQMTIAVKKIGETIRSYWKVVK